MYSGNVAPSLEIAIRLETVPTLIGGGEVFSSSGNPFSHFDSLYLVTVAIYLSVLIGQG